jgi:pimeloyl-ACP methyl ester carboxylesterase
MHSPNSGTTSLAASHAARIAAAGRTSLTPCGDGSVVWRRWGRGQPVVLLHGGYGSWTHWIRIIPLLWGDYEVLAPDLPGLGQSALPPGPQTPASSAQIIAEGITSLVGTAKPHLVGFSFGAHVGTLAAALLGDTLASFTISGCAALGLPHRDIDFRKERSSMTEAERREVHRHNLAALMIHNPGRIDALALYLQTENVARARFRSRPFARSNDIAVTLPHVTVPVRAIWGADDPLALPSVDACFDVLRQSHPELATRVIPDAGHWAAYEQAECFCMALVELLALPHRQA